MQASAVAVPQFNRAKALPTREEMMVQYLPLVHYVVRRMALRLPYCVDRDDVMSFGLLGLIDAIDRFDVTKGVKFESYAIFRIRGEIGDQLRNLDWIPRSARRRIRDVENIRDALCGSIGRPPTDEEVAISLGVSLGSIQKAEKDARVMVLSLNETRHFDDEGYSVEIGDELEDIEALDPLVEAENREIISKLLEATASLSHRERLLITLYYQENRTMKSIARILAISESRTCQLLQTAIRKLGDRLREFRDEAVVA